MKEIQNTESVLNYIAVISHGLKILEKILANFYKDCYNPHKIQLAILNFAIDVHLIDLSSIQDQAELSRSIRLEMARNNVQEGYEFSLRIIDFSRNEALPWHTFPFG